MIQVKLNALSLIQRLLRKFQRKLIETRLSLFRKLQFTFLIDTRRLGEFEINWQFISHGKYLAPGSSRLMPGSAGQRGPSLKGGRTKLSFSSSYGGGSCLPSERIPSRTSTKALRPCDPTGKRTGDPSPRTPTMIPCHLHALIS